MISKIVKGKGFRGALNYLMGERGQIIGGNMAGRTARELAAEFKNVRQLRPKVGKAVVHISLSAHPSDRPLTDAEMAAIAERVAMTLGYEHSPRVVIRHHDTEHQHVHLLLSKIDSKGRAVSDAHDYRKAEQVLRQIEADYGLSKLPSPTLKAVKPRANINQKIKENTMNEEYNTTATEDEKAFMPVLPPMEMKDVTNYGSKHANINAKRKYKRLLLDPVYEQMVKELFGTELQSVNPTRKGCELLFGPPKKLIDDGQTLTAHQMPMQEAAVKMVAIAKGKGWKQVSFTGSDAFVRLAMREALKQGLNVVPANLQQAGLLDEVKAEVSGEALVAFGSGKPLTVGTLDAFRKRRQDHGNLDKHYQPRKPWFNKQ